MIWLLVLFTMLVSPRFQHRDTASKILTPANVITIHLLKHIETSHYSLEARNRARRIVNQWYQANAEFISLQLGRMPWIDKNICGWRDWLAKARNNVISSGSPNWIDYSEATRLYVQVLIATRTSFQSELQRLWRIEWQYRWQVQGEWFPW